MNQLDIDGISNSNRLRDHHPEPFISAYREADLDEQAALREKLKQIDSGRLYDVLDDVHNHIAHADIKSRKELEDLYTEEFKYWIAAFGMVEDLNTFPDFTGVEK